MPESKGKPAAASSAPPAPSASSPAPEAEAPTYIVEHGRLVLTDESGERIDRSKGDRVNLCDEDAARFIEAGIVKRA